MFAILAVQVMVPLLLVAWMVFLPPRSTAGIVAQLAGSILLLLSLTHIGLWLFPPWWTPEAAAVLVTVAAAWQLGRMKRSRFPATMPGWAGVLFFSLTALGGVGFSILVRRASQPPSAPVAVDLAWPLAPGRYLIVNGGNRLLMNAHQQSFDSSIVRLRPWRGNGHAVDIVAINALGLRADGVLPRDPAQYHIFGVPVVAPCAGRVVVAVDGLPDMPVPLQDREHIAGNHVMLECDGIHVLLAHFQNGSLCVQTGEIVQLGQPLGQVGNSGASSEPHLHIHAQRPGPRSEPYGGDPVPLRLGGRYLVRGERVKD